MIPYDDDTDWPTKTLINWELDHDYVGDEGSPSSEPFHNGVDISEGEGTR